MCQALWGPQVPERMSRPLPGGLASLAFSSLLIPLFQGPQQRRQGCRLPAWQIRPPCRRPLHLCTSWHDAPLLTGWYIPGGRRVCLSSWQCPWVKPSEVWGEKCHLLVGSVSHSPAPGKEHSQGEGLVLQGVRPEGGRGEAAGIKACHGLRLCSPESGYRSFLPHPLSSSEMGCQLPLCLGMEASWR